VAGWPADAEIRVPLVTTRGGTAGEPLAERCRQANWDNVKIIDVDDDGDFIHVAEGDNGCPRGTLHRRTYEVELL
jgi:hypothetical protein